MQRSTAETTPAQLQQIVERRQACYEVWPDWAVEKGERVNIGFELDLCASAAGSTDSRGVEIYEELLQIARSVLPGDGGEAEFDVLPFDHAVHESPRRDYRPEIVLAVRILHKNGYIRPVDSYEAGCLRQIESSLHQLGLVRAY